jgi:hypothetical protein
VSTVLVVVATLVLVGVSVVVVVMLVLAAVVVVLVLVVIAALLVAVVGIGVDLAAEEVLAIAVVLVTLLLVVVTAVEALLQTGVMSDRLLPGCSLFQCKLCEWPCRVEHPPGMMLAAPIHGTFRFKPSASCAFSHSAFVKMSSLAGQQQDPFGIAKYVDAPGGGVVVSACASVDSITSSIAMSPFQVAALFPEKDMRSDSPEKLLKSSMTNLHWSPWLPEIDHND